MPDFGARIRPEQVDFTIRCRLAQKVYRREFFALTAVFLPCLLVTLAIVAFYRWHNEPAGSEWPLMAPIVVTVAAILVGIHIWSIRERRFVEKAPPAAAEVKEIETSHDCTYAHRLILTYRPMQHNAKGALLRGNGSSKLVVVAVESDLPGFTTQLRPGDSLSILYDPAEPDHVCVVEEERSAA
jgi:hypothetical protein